MIEAMFDFFNFHYDITPIYILFILIYGLCLGAACTTFWNRIPYGRDIGPGHKPRCNRCKKQIHFPYFLPIIGFILTNGKCKYCKMKISLYYLLIEFSVPAFTLFLSTRYPFYTEEFLIGSLFSAYMLLSLLMVFKNRKMNYHFVWFGICASFLFGFFSYPMEIEEMLIHFFLRIVVMFYIDKRGRFLKGIAPLFVVLAATVSPKFDLIFLGSLIFLKLALRVLEVSKLIGKYHKMKIIRFYLFLFHYAALFFH